MENNNGKGLFYGVIGVATLIVAIIGATFAYFTATANATGDTIQGGTNDDLSSALSLKITRVNPDAAEGVTSIDLVPTDIDGATLASVNAAVAANCAADGYTGCHLYRIDANTIQTVAAASINFESFSVTATSKADWSWVIYTGTNTTATALVENGAGNLSSAFTTFDMHHGAGLTAQNGTDTFSATYYLVIYLHDIDASQNTEGATDATGTYAGTVTMNAGGGQVRATFSA